MWEFIQKATLSGIDAVAPHDAWAMNRRNEIAALISSMDPAVLIEVSTAEQFPGPAPVYDSLAVSRSVTKITIVADDCLAVAVGLGPSVLLLNMANAMHVGGAFHRARGSQEEYLFRNTSLLASLWPRRGLDDERQVPGGPARVSPPFFPFPSRWCGVYSPSVDVFSVGDKPLGSCTGRISVVSVAAEDLRWYSVRTRANWCNTLDEGTTREVLRTVLWIAVKGGHRHLVLGALGCGAFGNPPKTIAGMWRELLFGEFRNAFETVVFAVAFSEVNLKAFQETFAEGVTYA